MTDLGSMSNADLLAWAGTMKSEPKELEACTFEISRRVFKKKMTVKQQQEFFTKMYFSDLLALLTRWEEGTLFDAQPYGWFEFLTANEASVHKDRAIFKQLEDLAGLCSREMDALIVEIRWFYNSRILPDIGVVDENGRRGYFKESGYLKGVISLEEDGLTKSFAEGRQAFETISKRYGWKCPPPPEGDEGSIMPTPVRPGEN